MTIIQAFTAEWFVGTRTKAGGKLAPGVYSLFIVNPDFRDKKIFMIR